MVKAVERAVEIGANALQIFSDNPTAWRRRANPPPELARFKKALREADIAPLAIHASYLINLAGPEDAFYEPSIELLAHELQAGVKRLGTGLARVFERLPSPGGRASGAGRGPLLVLESSAGGGGGIGTTVEELAMVLEAAAVSGAPVERIGFCLDTAHLWSAGYDLRDDEVLDRLVRTFDAEIGLARLRIVHLNDSKAVLGSHLDRHEHIGAGRLGSGGMGNVLRHPRLARAAFYLETPGMDEGYDAVNMERVRLLLAGRPLPKLPPEAQVVRGSRSRRAMPEADGAEPG